MGLKIDRRLAGDIGRITLLLAFFTTMALLLKGQEVRRFLFDLDTIRSTLKGGPDLPGRIESFLVFTFAGGVLIAIGLPRLWASAVGGIVYGAFMGTVLSVTASLIGSSALYIAGRYLLSGIVERRTGTTLRLWRLRFQENAFWWVLYGRLFPFSNSTLMSLLCGCSRVPFKAFMLGSLAGFIPLAAVMSTYGSGGVEGDFRQIGLATALLVVSVFARKIVDKCFPQAGKRQ